MRVAAVIIALKRKGKLSALLLWQLCRAASHKPAKCKSWCVEQKSGRLQIVIVMASRSFSTAAATLSFVIFVFCAVSSQATDVVWKTTGSAIWHALAIFSLLKFSWHDACKTMLLL